MTDFERSLSLKVRYPDLSERVSYTKQALESLSKVPEPDSKGYYHFYDFTWVVEVKKGGMRKGRKTTLHYGHIKGTKGKDGEGIDFWMDPEGLGLELFFVINQNAKGGGLDEHKVMVGFRTEEDARQGYLDNYPSDLGPKLLGSVKPMTLPDLKNWILEADKEKRAAVDGDRMAAVRAMLAKFRQEADTAGYHYFAVANDPADPDAGAEVSGIVDNPNSVIRQHMALHRDWAKQRGYSDINWGPGTPLARLQEAKARSDRGDYQGKHSVLRSLIKETPGEWQVEEDPTKKHVGLTHSPTNFKIHAPRDVAAMARPLPFRDRSEVYALKDNKVYGGKYDNGTFGVYGGGIDPGETPEEAAAREFAEESGYTVNNVKPVDGVDPFELEWKPPYHTPEQAERAKKFRGSRTRYFMGDLGERHNNPLVGPSQHTDQRLYDLDEALGLTQGKISSETLSKANANRQKVLNALKTGFTSSVSPVAVKTSADCPLGECCPHCDARLERGDDGNCNQCGKLWPEKEKRPYTVAVDLDGTIAEQEEPFNSASIGAPRPKAKHYLDAFRKAGARIIVFTVRGDTAMVKKWLDTHDLPYDFINENPDQPADASCKVLADAYWDDRAFNAKDLDEHGPSLADKIKGHMKEAVALYWKRGEDIDFEDGSKRDVDELAHEVVAKLRNAAGDSAHARLLHNKICALMKPFDVERGLDNEHRSLVDIAKE